MAKLRKSRWSSLAALGLSVGLALAVGAAIMALAGYNPAAAYGALLRGATGCESLGEFFTAAFTKRQFGNTLEYTMVRPGLRPGRAGEHLQRGRRGPVVSGGHCLGLHRRSAGRLLPLAGHSGSCLGRHRSRRYLRLDSRRPEGQAEGERSHHHHHAQFHRHLSLRLPVQRTVENEPGQSSLRDGYPGGGIPVLPADSWLFPHHRHICRRHYGPFGVVRDEQNCHRL